MNILAKFKCQEVAKVSTGQKDADGNELCQAKVQLFAVSDDANKQWSKWTPSGSIVMVISNEAAANAFEPGKIYFVEFKPE